MDQTSGNFAAGVGLVNPARDADWPAATPAGIRRYLAALAEKGPAHFAANAVGVATEILRVGDSLLPLLVSDGVAGKASILSPLGHHISYPIEEISRRSRVLTRPLLSALLSPLALTLKAGALDRVVLLNHWLLSGSPAPDLPSAAWGPVIAYLSARYPSHALVVQDVKPDLQPALAAALIRAGGLAVPTRQVQVIDPKVCLSGKSAKKKRYRRVVARRIAEKAAADLVSLEVARAQTARLAELYRASNIGRHSALNPDYLQAFFDLALDCEEFHLHAWRAAEGSPEWIVAFNLQRHDAEFIHWSTFGCEDPPPDGPERSVPSHYERVAATDIVVAEETGLMLDWGAGADEFKRLRGAVAHQQIEVVFVRHLAVHRRAAWHLLARLRRWRARQLGRGTAGQSF
jgi:hypothetical protein